MQSYISGMQAQAQNTYPGQVQTVAPKEIGFLQRAEGVRSGLDEIEQRLQSFCARVSGGPQEGQKSSPAGSGLGSVLSDSEDSIRRLLNILSTMEQAF